MFSPQKTFEHALPADDSWPAENRVLGYELRECCARAGFSEPEVRELNRVARSLGLKSIVAGTLATCLTAASVALIL